MGSYFTTSPIRTRRESGLFVISQVQATAYNSFAEKHIFSFFLKLLTHIFLFFENRVAKNLDEFVNSHYLYPKLKSARRGQA